MLAVTSTIYVTIASQIFLDVKCYPSLARITAQFMYDTLLNVYVGKWIEFYFVN